MKKRKIIYIVIGITSIVLIYSFLDKKINDMTNVEQILTNEIESGKSPSVQYYIFDSENIIKSFQLGYADISKQRQTDRNTTYNAFSVTKTFTALAVMQLAECGKIDLNKPIIDYLSDFQYGTEITIKQLLNHTAGIPNPIPLSWIHLDSEQNSFDRNQFFKPVFDKNNKIKSKPDEKFSYSNLGYIILGQLIESVSGKTYEEYVFEFIIQKLPISPADLTFTISDNENHAIGYHKKMSFSNLMLGFFIDKSKFMEKAEGKWRPFKTFYVNGAPYGGLIGKPTAFITYIQELLKENNALISNEYKQLLFQENKNTRMCLSWFAGELEGNKYFAHAGGGGGYYCEIRIYPDIKIGSVIFFNRTGMSDERFLDKLDKIYIKE
ncbi:MAG: beta-lactamase family protein [Marinilabiliaceae bacterium]|nr:beta-lactamase family protein [Marinilabiliaceae bacterium]